MLTECSSSIEIDAAGFPDVYFERYWLCRLDIGGRGATRDRRVVTTDESRAGTFVLGSVSDEFGVRDSGESDMGGGGKGLFRSVADLGDDNIGCLLVRIDGLGSAKIGERG